MPMITNFLGSMHVKAAFLNLRYLESGVQFAIDICDAILPRSKELSEDPGRRLRMLMDAYDSCK